MSTSLIRPDGQTLTFDATPRVSWQKNVSITDHPIEDGSTVSDHAQQQPDRVTLTGVVSDSPLGEASTDRVREALAFLNEAGSRAELLELESRFGVTGNWLLESWPHDVTQLRALAFEVSLRKVRIPSVQVVMLPRPQVRAGAPPDADVGTQTTQPVPQAEAEAVLKSWAASGLDRLLGR